MQLVIVTGMSGAGKSRAIDSLEDIGFFCVDNMTPRLIPTFIKILSDSNESHEKVAFGADVRLGSSFQDLFSALEELRDMKIKYKILFVDADNDVIIRRYQETRRKHPLQNDENQKDLLTIIENEREMLKKAKNIADYVVDTSLMSIGMLKEKVSQLFLNDISDSMKVNVESFGYKFGLPRDSDLVFDVRCLPNPFYVEELKHHTGLEKPVRDFVMQYDQSQELLSKLNELLEFLLPLYISEGKSQLTISVGCTGGRHRSVVFAELLKEAGEERGYNVSAYHRDIDR
ncbi:MAG: RNase adapter RapZ [Clostridiales bacterium]|nr:RNase adapter RapZ [Clostridiales bacterium]